MNCVVFSNNREKAEGKIEEIKNNKGVPTFIKRNYAELVCAFEDGEVWRTLKVNLNCRGIRFNKAYIDKDITDDVLHKIILPMALQDAYVDYF